jgi:ParB-like chromosome segregation protein Spo0J
MEVTRRLIADLTLDPRNARTHSQKNLDAIATSLTKFGQRKPIVVTGDGVVLAGNGTLEAARSLGWKEITIARVPEDWSQEQVVAYALADNRSAELAEWDTQVLADQLLDISMLFDTQDFGFNPLSDEFKDDTPKEFTDFSGDVNTAYQCPKCGYEWNGSPR